MKAPSARAALAGLMATAAAAACAGASLAATAAKPTEWKVWGGDAGETHWSELDQITPRNVTQLKPVWIYDPGTTGRGWEAAPLVIDGIMYFSDPSSDIVAVDPETGKEIWKWKAPPRSRHLRGISYWPGDGQMKPRLVLLQQGRLYTLDLKTGEVLKDWVPEGSINVSLDREKFPNAGPSSSASPPVIYKNMVILSTSEGSALNRPAGDPRAFDLRTGKLLWRTRLIPGAGEPGGESWGPKTQEVASPGAWGLLSLDESDGTVFVPTDSPGPDYVGIWRPGDNKYADSTVAIDANTGKIKWAFQTHHHDLFDWDSMAAPALAEVVRNGRKIPVVVQTTKLGMMWILDRKTGQPIHGYEERPVPKSDIPGEQPSPTQPFTLKPPPLARMSISRDTLTNVTAESHQTCLEQWDKENMKNAGPFTPPFREGTTIFLPGSSGAISWGGATINPELGYAFTNVTNIPVKNKIAQTPNVTDSNMGWHTIGNFTRFADKFGRPCSDGRHGELLAVNLSTGDIAWRIPFGTLEDEYGPKGRENGAPNIGPSLATKSGLLFIGATADERFRAFEAKTGKLLWETRLSASGVSNPITFVGKSGRQYVIIGAGGPGTAGYRTIPQWGYRQMLVAFALPRPGEKTLDIVTPYPRRMPMPGEDFVPQ